jgi:hypothetical protein
MLQCLSTTRRRPTKSEVKLPNNARLRWRYTWCGSTIVHWTGDAYSPQQPADSGKGKHNYSCTEFVWGLKFSRRLISKAQTSGCNIVQVYIYRCKPWRTLLSVFKVYKRGGRFRCNFGACLLHYNCIWSRPRTFPIQSFCKMTRKMLIIQGEQTENWRYSSRGHAKMM